MIYPRNVQLEILQLIHEWRRSSRTTTDIRGLQMFWHFQRESHRVHRGLIQKVVPEELPPKGGGRYGVASAMDNYFPIGSRLCEDL